ncbi:ectoine/hydroxyectoine ABC transporter permease subunit EhuD [Rhizobium leguminosarum]|uniref:ectoine/hydroxyectoine ABC transporter permease subunit EhuD n=1 Tax=Rhizobium leguminosarum TaxID=384 RepID=UPI003F96C4F6
MELISWSFAIEVLPALLRGAVVTFLATVGGFIASLAVGAILLALYRAPSAPVALAGRSIIELLRSTPLLIQVYFLFFVLPDVGVILKPVTTGIIALGLYHGAYVAEAYRAGLDSIPRGQWDAVESLRFSRYSALRYLILPQAIIPLIPALGNTFITMLKDTPILAAITVPEMMFEANDAGSQSFRYIEPITMAALGYLIMSAFAAAFVHMLQRNLGRYR